MISISQEEVIKVLQQIRHPEKGKDIISLDLVKGLSVSEKEISFTLYPSKVGDPLLSSIKKACIQALTGQFGKDISVEIDIAQPDKKVAAEGKKVLPGVKNIIVIASGKGGVGKSTVAANLAVAVAATGAKVGLIDADIFGPSIPKMLNVEFDQPMVKNVDGKDMIVPVEHYGVKVLSIGFFVDDKQPVIWRGPMASGALKQLIEQGDWGDLDYLFIDTPPGTSDIHITLVQEIQVTGAVIVSTPQKVALADAIKGLNMFTNEKINVPVLGLVENMSWFTPKELPGNKYFIFGKEGCKELAKSMNVPLLGQIPIVQGICEGGDLGVPSVLDGNSMDGKAFIELAKNLIEQVKLRKSVQETTKS